MNPRRSIVVLSAFLTLLGGSTRSSAQTPTGSVVGRVVDSATTEPIARANVAVVGGTQRALTRDDGTFILTAVPTGAQRLRITRIGYRSAERPVDVEAGTPRTITLSLARTAAKLQEMVVVGYGTQRREDLTGAIASVQSEELAKTTVATLEQGLQGRVPGVQVTQGDAAPGGGMRVQIRGTNSMNSGSAQPLYVIDGVPVASSGSSKVNGSLTEGSLRSLTETNPLAELAPGDIESIDILKDASATAIYGSRGANGVVIITTRRGVRGSGGLYSLNVVQGYQTVVRTLNVMSPYQFATYVNKAFTNSYGPLTQYPYGGRPSSLTPDSLQTVVGSGTNWQDEIFHNAVVTDGTLGFSGGDDNGSYNVSGNLLKQQGVVRGSEFARGGLRINLDRNVTQRFRLSSNLAVTRSVNDMVRTSTINGWNSVGIIRSAVTYIPWMMPDTTRADSRQESSADFAQYGANPLRYTDEVNENDQLTRGIGGVRGVLSLPFGLALDENVGVNYERRTYGAYYPRTVNEGRAAGGDALSSGSEFGNLLSETLVRFNREYDIHRVEAVGGFTYQTDNSTWNSQEVQGFPDDILGGNVLQNGTVPQAPQTGRSTAQLASWLGRVNYSFMGRYLVTGTVRADGSSKFAANNKWATFPALAVAWKAIEEPLLRRQHLFSELKLRASYGKSGNQAIGAFQSLPAIAGVATTQNEAVVPAYVVTQLGNPNLRWETTDQYDAGLDFGVASNRLTGTVDVYRKNTYDLLQLITLAQSTGFANAWINSGNVTNRGVELGLNVDVLRSESARGLTWSIGANASHNVNRIESLGNNIAQQFAARLGVGGSLEAAPFIQKPGLPIGAMWGYRADGIVRTPADSAAYSKILGSAIRVGDLKYRDLDGDGKITALDQGVIGDANPRWVWGVTNSVRFGNFDATALVTAVRGNSIINAERMRYLVLDGTINMPSEYVTNTFDPVTNPDGIYPMIRQDRKSDARFSDIYIEDGSYVRLKNVQVGYNLTLPRFRTARLYLNAINLATWTNYTGFDPEVSAFGGSDRPGVDLGNYPQARTISVGVNTTF